MTKPAAGPTARARFNGLDTQALTQTVDALKRDRTLAKFEFRAGNSWVGGAENRSTIQGFYGAGQEDTSREAPWVFTNGEPPVLLGANEGANPVEFLLHALAGCVTTTSPLLIQDAGAGIVCGVGADTEVC